MGLLCGVGFEPTKHYAIDLESIPFNQTRESAHYNDKILFLTELLMATNQKPLTGFEPATLRLEVLRAIQLRHKG